MSLIANPQPSAEPIYLVTDAGSPVAAFTYLKRRHGTLNNALVYTFRAIKGHLSQPCVIS